MSERPKPPEDFVTHVAIATAAIGRRSLNADLEAMLNRDFARDGEWFARTYSLCLNGVAEGWLCSREAGGIKFGRAVPAGDATHRFSVDVVEMQDVVGPHHAHPKGEIDLIMPLDDSAQFDGKGAGWVVYGPGSAHFPTVNKGKALVLYLLPEGAIDFTR
jgi:hypothetical protein